MFSNVLGSAYKYCDICHHPISPLYKFTFKELTDLHINAIIYFRLHQTKYLPRVFLAKSKEKSVPYGAPSLGKIFEKILLPGGTK